MKDITLLLIIIILLLGTIHRHNLGKRIKKLEENKK